MIIESRPVLVVVCVLAFASGQATADTATYQLTFTATWSAQSHPEDFPAGAHFSPLIGGVHAADATFWAVGELATLGMRRMAEWGAITPLDTEIQAAIDAGLALAVVTGAGIPSPGQTTVTFTATDDFSLLTLVTMIAPSPDWFVGVAGLALRPGGTWVENLTVDLLPYDAGTDGGPAYGSPDQPEVPPVPIAPITGSPFTPGVPLGTFTLSLLSTTAVPPAPTLALHAYPNPFNPATTVTFVAATDARLSLAVHDLRGRRVATLLDGEATGGAGSVTWNGRDARGRRVAAGAYVLHLRDASGQTATRVITLVE